MWGAVSRCRTNNSRANWRYRATHRPIYSSDDEMQFSLRWVWLIIFIARSFRCPQKFVSTRSHRDISGHRIEMDFVYQFCHFAIRNLKFDPPSKYRFSLQIFSIVVELAKNVLVVLVLPHLFYSGDNGSDIEFVGFDWSSRNSSGTKWSGRVENWTLAVAKLPTDHEVVRIQQNFMWLKFEIIAFMAYLGFHGFPSHQKFPCFHQFNWILM